MFGLPTKQARRSLRQINAAKSIMMEIRGKQDGK
jgi:hypothetical protein